MSEYSYLEHKVVLVTDNDTACQALERLVAEMRKRQLLLKQSGFINIAKYNARCNGKIARLVTNGSYLAAVGIFIGLAMMLFKQFCDLVVG